MSAPNRKPGIHWLRGDELVVGADGQTDLVSRIFEQGIRLQGSNHLRTALAIFPDYASLTRENVERFATNVSIPAVRAKAIEQIQQDRSIERKLILEHLASPDIWRFYSNDPSPREVTAALAKKRAQSVAMEKAILPTLNAIRRDAEGWTTRAKLRYEESTATMMPGEQLLLKPGFESSVDILEKQSVLTPELSHYFAAAHIPICLVPNLHHMAGTPDAKAYFYSNNDGLVLDHDCALGVSSPDRDTRHDAARSFSRGLVTGALASFGLDRKMLGIASDADIEAIHREFKAVCKSYMLPRQWKEDQKIPGNYTIPDIASHMHFLLHGGFYDPAVVRKDLPKCCALYDRFIGIIRQQTAQLEKKPPFVPYSPSKERTAPPPAPDLQPWQFLPKRRFTGEMQETQLLNDLRGFVEDALMQEPPFAQCHVRLDYNAAARDAARNGASGRQEPNFQIVVLLRNRDRQTREYALTTGTPDLSEAMRLKQAVQSHLLSHPSIEPLYLPGRTDSPASRPDMQTIMPHWQFEGSRLMPREKFIEGELTFLRPVEGEQTERQTVRIPLGLDYHPQDGRLMEEAQRRLGFVAERVRHLAGDGQWETLGELVSDLKRDVRQHVDAIGTSAKHFGWKSENLIPLDRYERSTALAFPSAQASNSQQTCFARPSIRWETTGANPTWRLIVPLHVTGLGGESGDFEKKISINLHTSDEVSAQQKAIDAVESLKQGAADLARRYPEMYWERDPSPDHESLRVTDIEGHIPRDPDPQRIEHLHEDMAHCKTGFRIDVSGDPMTLPDGRLQVTFRVERGTSDMGDLIAVKGAARQPLQMTLTVAADQRDQLPDFLQQANRNFQSAIGEIYSNRTLNDRGESIRKHRQGFHIKTIQAHFEQAIDEQRKKSGIGTADDTSAHAGAVRQRGSWTGEARGA